LAFEILERRSLLSSAGLEDPLEAKLGIGDISESGPEAEARLTSLGAVSESPSDQPPGIVNRQVTDDPGVQQMPSIAIDPYDSQHLVLAYMDYSLPTADEGLPGEGYAGIGVAVSDDAGETWQHSSIPLPAGFDQGAANPIVRFDDRGNVFVSFMAATFLGEDENGNDLKSPLTNANFGDRWMGLQSNNGIFVARSDDGGLAWQEPVAVVAHLYDGQDPVFFEVLPDLAIDTFVTLPNGGPNPNYANLYVVWTRLYPPGQQPGYPQSQGGGDVMISVSRDGGQSWHTQLCPREVWQDTNGDNVRQDDEVVKFLGTPIVYLSENGSAPPGMAFVDQPHLAIGPEADIYVSEYGGSYFVVHHSADAGATFDNPDLVSEDRIAFGWNQMEVEVSGLPHNGFRTPAVRAIVADPTRPGYVYAVEANKVRDVSGGLIDGADVYFARSTDHGVTWQQSFRVGPNSTNILNDDNGGRSASGSNADHVITGQALPRVALDPQGNIEVIWYDTRRDPADHLLDVFGTTSADGGQTFAPNFRVTDSSFDADRGAFTDAADQTDYYLGDFLGLALANNTAYAAWADTRDGNQDIYFARYSVQPAPSPLDDRFEPNQPASIATDVGRVVQRFLPKLAVRAGDEDWFRMQASASGDLIASAVLASPAASPVSLHVELWDQTGTTLLAGGRDVLDASQNAAGQEVRFPGDVGRDYLVRIFGASHGETHAPENVSYSLHLQSLTAELGTRVSAQVPGSVEPGGTALYHVAAAAAGSLDVRLTGRKNTQGELNLQILDPETFAVQASAQPPPGPTWVASSVEPNDSIGQPSDTGLAALGSVTIDGLIGDGDFASTTGDYDFYRFHAAASEKVTVDLDPLVFSSDLDGVLTLYDGAGQVLHMEDSNAPGLPERFSYLTQSGGDYFVTVSACVGDPPPYLTGQYRLTITTDAVGPGEVKSANLPVQPGQSVLLLVSAEGTASGGFTLDVKNPDASATPQGTTLFIPNGLVPSTVGVADFNRDGKPDLAVSNTTSSTVGVFLGNGDGTFQSPRQFAVGVFKNLVAVTGLASFRRDLRVGDFDGDDIPDLVVTNSASADVSLLLGRGDGTFEPQRRFDATTWPIGLDVGDVNHDGKLDLAVIDNPLVGVNNNLSVLLGRGDGTFQPQRKSSPPASYTAAYATLRMADFNKDGRPDLVVSGGLQDGVDVYLGSGDGTFAHRGRFDSNNQEPDITVADVDGDGNLDLLTPFLIADTVSLLSGNGDGTFRAPREFFVGQSPMSVALADFGNQVTQLDGSTALGPPDGHPDLIVANSGIVWGVEPVGGPQIVVLPGLFDEHGRFLGFGSPQQIARPLLPSQVVVSDLNGDGREDLVVADRDGVLIIYGRPPVIPSNDTPQTGRDLGAVVHLIEPTRTIVPGHEDAYYKLTVPTEAISAAGDEILDFSGRFEHTEGAGLAMEVLDAQGNRLALGERFRVLARQGEELLLHVFGVESPSGVTGETPVLRGAGAYTLDIDVLPQVVCVEAEALLPGVGAKPGGPTTNLVLTFQGDRLDPDAAEHPGNYTVTCLGEDGQAGTADDQVIPVQSAVYNPGANVDVSSGRTYPTAVRQTVTLVFDQPLPAGSYQVELSPQIQTAAFNEAEGELLADPTHFAGHPVVSRVGGRIAEGVRLEAVDLVLEAGTLGDLSAFERGTRFLTQFQNDLGARVDAILTRLGDDPSLTASISRDILERLAPSLGEPGQRPTSMLVLFLDPVSYGLASLASGGQQRAVYDLQTNTVANSLPKTFVEVGGNVEVIVVANAAGTYRLDLADVPARARGTAVLLEAAGDRVLPLTAAIRDGQRSFLLSMASTAPAVQNRSNTVPPAPAQAAAVFADLARSATTLEVIATPSPASGSAPASTIGVTPTRNVAGESASPFGSSLEPSSAGGNARRNQAGLEEFGNFFTLLIKSLEAVLRDVLGMFWHVASW
jgi:hypothetical protein